MTRSRAASRGGSNSPPSASIAPLPLRVGITEPRSRRSRRQGRANGRPIRRLLALKERRVRAGRTPASRCRDRRGTAAARRSVSTVIRLFERGRAPRDAPSRVRSPPRAGRSGDPLKSQTALAVAPGEKRRMRFDDDPLEAADLPRMSSSSDGGIARGSKKLPALYSLICLAGRRAVPSAARICVGNGAARHGLVERVDPQVAHHAAKRAFAIGEEDDRRGTSAPAASGSSSHTPRTRAVGSSTAFGPRRSTTQRS